MNLFFTFSQFRLFYTNFFPLFFPEIDIFVYKISNITNHDKYKILH
jgi:hypothetical protein